MPASAKALGPAMRKASEEVKSSIWLKCPSKSDRYFHWITVTPRKQLSWNDRDDDYRRLDSPTEAEHLDRPCSRLRASFAESAGGA
jgi:hypothetical protein